MKKLPRVISLALIGTLSFAAVGTAFAAWSNFGSASLSSCNLDSSFQLPLIAQDGDVVTTPKWNMMACSVWFLFSSLSDFPRKDTPFLWAAGSNTIGGKEGYVAGGVGLGYTSASPGVPFIGFFNGDYHYQGAFSAGGGRPSLGSLNFMPKDKGGDDSLRFNGFGGGIRITPGADSTLAPTGSFLVGWERISLSDTAGFEGACQYRIKTTLGQFLYPTVRDSTLSLVEDGNWSDDRVLPVQLQVDSSAKAVLNHYSSVGPHVKAHGDVQFIEKLCLPSYNPNNY